MARIDITQGSSGGGGGGDVTYGTEPGAVSSSTSGSAGSADSASRSDHNHDLGEHDHADAAGGGTITHSDTTGQTANDHHNQSHGDADHSGTIGTESQITFDNVAGHGHTTVDSKAVDHVNLANKGSNTHAQLDTHVAADDLHIATYADVTAAQAATGGDGDRCFVLSLNNFYVYEASGSAYTVDGTFVLSTGDGGNTRWLGHGPNYLHSWSVNVAELITDDATGGVTKKTRKYGGNSGVSSRVIWQDEYWGVNDATEDVEFARITATIDDASDGTEDGILKFGISKNGGLDDDAAYLSSTGFWASAFRQSAVTGSFLYRFTATQHSTDSANPALKAYGNNAGAHEALLQVHSDNASASGPLATYLQDGTGTLGQYTRGITDDATPGVMKWTRTRGAAAGQDADELTQFSFYGLNDAGTPESIEFAQILTSIVDASDGTEAGGLALKVANGTDGTLDTMIQLAGNNMGFYGASPVLQPSLVSDPAGGGTQDAEARTAIVAIIDAIVSVGLMASA